MILIAVLYHLILFIGDTILLGGFKPGYEVLDLSGIGDIFIECGADEDFILDDGHEF